MRSLSAGAYVIATQTRTVELTGTIEIDEYGYWATDDGTLLLHVAHGSLLSIEPVTPPVSSTAEDARDKLRTRAGR